MALVLELTNSEMSLINKLLNKELKSAKGLSYIAKMYDLQNKLIITK